MRGNQTSKYFIKIFIKFVFFNQKFIAKDKLLGYTVTAAGGKDHGKAGNQVNSE